MAKVKVFVAQSEKNKCTPTKGQTLGALLAANGLSGKLEEVALYNWGTKEAAAINRALVELVGCSAVKENPAESVLDPALGTTKALYKPDTWKPDKPLALEKTYTVKVKKRLPAVAVAITKLSKWFIPGTETCDLEYRLEGVKERATKVDYEVYASNYCKAAPTAEGEFFKYTYEASTVPIRQKRGLVGVEPSQPPYAITDWKGESDASEGILKPRGTEKRTINVACSPYTVLFRFYKDEGDKDVKVSIEPFWPRWKPPTGGGGGADTLEEASLVIKWKIENDGGGKLKLGQLIVWDKDDQPVFQAGLDADKLKKGSSDNTAWKSEGKNLVKPEGMPYRVQIQAHSDGEEDQGVAVAAMHTEVRLYVPKQVGTNKDEPTKDPQCLGFGLAPFLPYRDKDADRPADTTDEWFKLRLAEAGFYPGPVGKDAGGTDYERALKEFQRSYPANAAAPFKRLQANGKASKNDAKPALTAATVTGARPMFGNSASRNDYTGADVLPLLQKPGEKLIVWVDDRHCYTHGAWKPAAAPPFDTLQDITKYYDMEDYRGDMDIGDGRVDKDLDSTARPWIPLEARLALLSKNDPLHVAYDAATAATQLPTVTDAMRQAIGPLRVDWTFTEIGAEVDVIPAETERDVAKITVVGGGGTFTLKYDGEDTAALAVGAPTADVEAAFKALGKIAADAKRVGGVSVTGPDGGPWLIMFETGFSGPAVTTVTVDGAALTAPTATVVDAGTNIFNPQKFTVTLAGATGGTFTLECDGAKTAGIAAKATAAAVEAALKGLPVAAADPKKAARISVTGPNGGPWVVRIKRSNLGSALVGAMTADGAALTPAPRATVAYEKLKITRAHKFVEQLLTKEPAAGVAKKDGKLLYTNAPAEITSGAGGKRNGGGIRPDDLRTYYKAPFGLAKAGSLEPWLAVDDSAHKVVCSLVHDDLGQDEKKIYPDFLGKAGIYLTPSRIAGDGYRFRAQVSFQEVPGGAAANLPNRQVLADRYPKLPQAHTPTMRIWRKTSFRGYVGWVDTLVPGWETAMDQAAAFYRAAHVHFVHEGPAPTTHQSFPVKGASKLVTDAEYKGLVEQLMTDNAAPYAGLAATLTEGYIWPYLNLPHFGIGPRVEDLNAFVNWLYGTIEETSWDYYSLELIHLIIAKIEANEGRMRGHVLAEFDSSPKLLIVEYQCDVNAAHVITEIVNDPGSAQVDPWLGSGVKMTLRQDGRPCKAGGCAGHYASALGRVLDHLPLCAIGRPLGGSWLYTPRSSETWAHEVGHHRHLEHAQAWANRNQIAPGGKVKQHDSAPQPQMTADGLTAWQKAWDRFCIMSYDKGVPRRFCGKCLLKNRGWAVEGVTNPAGDVHD